MKENAFRMCMLFDFYGPVLTERQQEVFDLYYNEDLSLTEISEHANITRQGVRDAIVKASNILNDMEEKLGLVEKLQASRQAIEEIDARIDELTADCQDSKMADKLKIIKTIIDKELDQ